MHKRLLFSFLLGLWAGFLNAEGVEAAQNDAQTSLEEQKEQLLGLLAQVDEKYGDVAASIRDLDSQFNQATDALTRVRNKIAGAQDEMDALGAELGGQIKAAYALGQQDRLKMMLNQQDPALASRMMVYYEYLNRVRLAKLNKLHQTIVQLTQFDQEKLAETERLEQSREQKKQQQAALAAVKKQRNELVAKLNGGFDTADGQLRLVQENEAKLIELIQALEDGSDSNKADTETQDQGDEAETVSGSQASGLNAPLPELGDSFPKLTGPFATLKGKLPFPAKGKLEDMFGGAASANNSHGVVIGALEGGDVRAITQGTVVYAGNLKGYGQLVILEHDGQFMTLYAFNQSLYKHKGDTVEAGEVIASVGQSGGRSKPGVYFEIRQKGKPVSPMLWCKY